MKLKPIHTKVSTTLLFLLMLPALYAGEKKNHLTFYDTFFGSEDDYQVCYPKEHRTFFYQIIIFGAIAIALLMYIIYIRSRNNKILKQKNKVIEQQNKEMVDSIKYARNLQRTLIPTTAMRKNCGKQLEVMYTPKDIVSGDFYWIKRIDNLLFTAVIDCTGHGVPGAFLSVLAHNAIERAVNEQGLKKPDLILDSMNTYVKEVLKQEMEDGGKDGMEVGLMVMNTENNSIEYAGANIDLVYLQNGKIMEIQATKCTVGSVQAHVVGPPANHCLQLKKGDRIFMFSDGVPDQFGGEKNKKLGKKKLKEYLEKSSDKNISEQYTGLCTFHNSWKGKNEQTDDVLLMMVEI